MPYSPRYEEVFEGAVIDNLIVIVARDMKPALDYFYAADNLPDFAERTLGNFIRLSFPALAVAPRKVTEVEGEHALDSNIVLDVDFAVTDVDAPAATRKAVKYERALKSILRNASRADWITGLTTPQLTAIQIEISHEYSDPYKDPNVSNEWMVAVSNEVTVKFFER